MWETTKIILEVVAIITGVFVAALSLSILFLFSIGLIQLVNTEVEDDELTIDQMLEQ
jgi:uncharacterized protein (DUF3084 family)